MRKQKNTCYPEMNFMYPNLDCISSTNRVNEKEYYIFKLPTGKRIYGKTKEELLNKIQQESDRVKSWFENDMNLKDALILYNSCVYYAPERIKDFLERLIETLAEAESELFSKHLVDVLISDIEEISKLAMNLLPEQTDSNFASFISDFVLCLKWLDIIDQNEKTNIRLKIKGKTGTRVGIDFKSQFGLIVRKTDLDSINNELTIRNNLNKSIYGLEYIVILITLHTGIFSRDAFNLFWKDIDFDKRKIIVRGNKYEMNSILFNVLKEYKEMQHVSDDNTHVFASIDNGKSYSNILTLYQSVKKNALVVEDLSLRDLSLIQGKKMLLVGEKPEEVADKLGIAYKGLLWKRMENAQFLDPANEIFSDNIEKNSSLEELQDVIRELNPQQIAELIKYAKYIQSQ